MKRREFLAVSTLASLGLSLPFKARAQVRPAPPPLSAYAKSPLIEDITLSPDSKYIAYMSEKDSIRTVYLYEIDTKIISNYVIGDIKARSLFFASPSHLIVITTITQAIELYGDDRHELSLAHVIDIKTGEVNVLFNWMRDYYRMVTGDLHLYKRDGHYFLTASNVELQPDWPYVLYEFPLDTLKPRRLDTGTRNTLNWVLDGTGNLIARSSFDDEKSKWTLEYREKEHWKKIYEITSKLDFPKLLGLGRDGKSVVLSLNSGPSTGEYVEVSPEGLISEPLENGNKASAPIFHPLTKKLCGFASTDDWVEYNYFDPTLKTITDGANTYFEGYRYSFYDFAEDLRKVLVYFEGDKNSGTYSLMDFSTGQETLVGENYPEVGPDWIVQKQKITYKAADDLEITAYLTLPPHCEAKNLPLVVFPHGGPQSRDRLDFDWQVEALASRGYAVLQPNFRGSEGYGLAFVEAGYGQWGKKMQTDLSDGVRHLAKLGTIDPKRVAIYGASYGGYAALAGACFDPDVYRCAISVAGISDLKAMLEREKDDNGSTKTTSALYLKRLWADVPLDSISPAKHAAEVTIPILLIHGKNDTVVPIDQSRRMNKAMKAADKDVTFIEFDKEDHWQSLAPARLEMIEAVMAFLDKHNPAFI